MVPRDLFLRLVPWLTFLLMVGPLLTGLCGTILPGFGYFPALGLESFSLDPWRAILTTPGIGQSVWLSAFVGLSSTLLALGVVIGILAAGSGKPLFHWITRALSPILAVPHAAAAFGLAFLIAPSGFLSRLVSPWATGWTAPPNLLILNDPFGGAMIFGLIVKEVPFLLLMALAALPQIDPIARQTLGQSLGYSRIFSWIKGVFPALYRQIRLPVYVVLAYAASVVDVALILGPSTPPVLSVQILRWMSDPDLSMRLLAAAAATLQFLVVLATLCVWWVGEQTVRILGRRWCESGTRGIWTRPLEGPMLGLGFATAGLLFAGLAVLVLWSLASSWFYPAVWPSNVGLQNWTRFAADLSSAATSTAIIGAGATGVALVLTLLCLEAEDRFGVTMSARALFVLYLPLLVPQIAFLPGLQFLTLQLGIKTGLLPVIWAHLVFVMPYVFLSLSGPWRALDPRYAVYGATLGARGWRVFFTIKLPMMLRAILTAAAVGIAVSVAQYLPSLLIGGGRVVTLTTEALALAAGGDRRAISVFALAQTLAALLPFAMAIALPAIVWRHRKGLQHA